MKLIALSICAAFLASCAVLEKIAENQIYIAPLVKVATQVVLDKAVSPHDLADKEAEIIKVADAILKIDVTHKLTEVELREFLSSKLPAKDHWKRLEDKIVKYYLDATKNIKDEDVANAVAVLKQIAQGLNDAVK